MQKSAREQGLPADIVAAEIFTPMSGVIGKHNGDRTFVSDACVEVAAEAVRPARGRADREDDLIIDGFRNCRKPPVER